MSDGLAKYPEEEVLAIKGSNNFKQNKIKFTAIGYGKKEFKSL
jgi:hypothetical protein